MKPFGWLVPVVLAVTMAGCVTYPQQRGYGPPPHAPAHGYRYMHKGAVLVYNSHLDLYVVKGYPGVYFHNGHYYKRHKNHWLSSYRYDGPWELVYRKHIPPSLRDRDDKRHRGGGWR